MTEMTVLEDYLAAFAADWIKAGQPGLNVTIAMTKEIARLRADLETARRQLWRDWVEGGSDGARQAFEATDNLNSGDEHGTWQRRRLARLDRP